MFVVFVLYVLCNYFCILYAFAGLDMLDTVL